MKPMTAIHAIGGEEGQIAASTFVRRCECECVCVWGGGSAPRTSDGAKASDHMLALNSHSQ